MQGFRKVDPDRWEFANEYFLRDQQELLNEIHRRKPSSSERSHKAATSQHDYAALEVGAYGGLQAEVDALKRDKTLLMQEVIRLRQAQQAADEEIGTLSERIELTEQRQKQMLGIVVQALQHPALLQHFMSSSPSIKRIEDGRLKKKRRAHDGSESDGSDSGEGPSTGVGNNALIVHNGKSAQQSLNDLAQAFMQLLNTQQPSSTGGGGTDKEKRAQSRRRQPTASQGGPIIEEDPATLAVSNSKGEGSSPLLVDNVPYVEDYHTMPSAFGGYTDNYGMNGGPEGTDGRGGGVKREDNIPRFESLPLGPDGSPVMELPMMPSLELGDFGDLSGQLQGMMSMPSQDLLINDDDLAKLSENWNQVHGLTSSNNQGPNPV